MPRTIPPIRPQAPDSWPSIMTVAQEGGLADAYANDPLSGWQVGVQSLDFETIEHFGWPPDYNLVDGVQPADESATAYLTEKPDAVHPEVVVFYPFTFGVSVGCPSGQQVPPGQTFEQWAADLVLGRTARAVSSELWTGHLSQMHSLMRDAVDLTNDVAVPPAIGFGLIQEAVGDFGTWHVSSFAEATLRAEGFVYDTGLVPRGPGGWPISFGPNYGRGRPISSPWRLDTREAHGYIGAAHSSAAATGNEVYLVGHAGRIEVAVRDVPPELYGGASYRHVLANMGEAMRERRGIFRYAALRTYAALIDLTLEAGS